MLYWQFVFWNPQKWSVDKGRNFTDYSWHHLSQSRFGGGCTPGDSPWLVGEHLILRGRISFLFCWSSHSLTILSWNFCWSLALNACLKRTKVLLFLPLGGGDKAGNTFFLLSIKMGSNTWSNSFTDAKRVQTNLTQDIESTSQWCKSMCNDIKANCKASL